MNATELTIPGVFLIETEPHKDDRGYFVETFREDKLASLGLPEEHYVQHNQTFSIKPGTVRGFHFQIPGYNRIARVTHGEILLAVVDLRHDSPSYGDTSAVLLNAWDTQQLYIPAGTGWAYMTKAEWTQVEYISSKVYNPAADRTIRYDTCGVLWPSIAPITISERDANGFSLEDWMAHEEAELL